MKPEEIGIASGALLAALLDTLIEKGHLTRGDAAQVVTNAQALVPKTRTLANRNATQIIAAVASYITVSGE